MGFIYTDFNEFIKEAYKINKYKTIINVDIQKEYEEHFTFDISDWSLYINESYYNNNAIIFMFNGSETTPDTKDVSDYKLWLKSIGISDDVLSDATFYDKGYDYFRYCIDENIDEDKIVELVRFMFENNIKDTVNFTNKQWNNFETLTKYNKNELRELLENSDNFMLIPEMMVFLKDMKNIILLGGSEIECLKEVEIALKALHIPFKKEKEFIF